MESPWWQPDSVLRLVTSLMLVMLGSGLLRHLLDSVMSDTAVAALANTVFQLGIVGVIYLFLRENAIGWSRAFGFRRGSLKRIALLGVGSGILVVPVTIAIGLLCYHAMQTVGAEPAPQTVVQDFREAASPWQQAYLAVVAVAVAPFMEECLFRGILYPVAKQLWGTSAALWSTAVIFALSHGNLMSFLPLVFLAVVLTRLYEATGNLLTPMLTHAVFNGVNLLLLLLGSGIDSL